MLPSTPKPPHPLILQAIDAHYTYDPDTGVIYKNGKLAASHHKGGAYIALSIGTIDTTYKTMRCPVSAHHVAWYLTYGEWSTHEIDHIDGDGTNNRLNNLRLATRSQNNYNRGKMTSKPTSSKYKGIYWKKSHSAWYAHTSVEGKEKFIGYFPTEIEAARAYDIAVRELHGEFAALNFPTTPHQDLPGDVGVEK